MSSTKQLAATLGKISVAGAICGLLIMFDAALLAVGCIFIALLVLFTPQLPKAIVNIVFFLLAVPLISTFWEGNLLTRLLPLLYFIIYSISLRTTFQAASAIPSRTAYRKSTTGLRPAKPPIGSHTLNLQNRAASQVSHPLPVTRPEHRKLDDIDLDRLIPLRRPWFSIALILIGFICGWLVNPQNKQGLSYNGQNYYSYLKPPLTAPDQRQELMLDITLDNYLSLDQTPTSTVYDLISYKTIKRLYGQIRDYAQQLPQPDDLTYFTD